VTQDCAKRALTTAKRVVTLEPAPFVIRDSTWMEIRALRVMLIAYIALAKTTARIVSKEKLSRAVADALTTANRART